jgi:lipopolysaccharide/colanic/teichoic acid biosynthesis glycosyltransferase
MATIALSIWLSMGPLVLFRQKRAGYKGCIFTLLKFRTMQEMRDTERQLLPDKDRLTKVGILLRRFSLDELPQFWNVWKGEMSLVGPRPLLVDYLPRYSPEQARRHEVKPGVTGWAQVNGRNALSWDERFELDVWYVDNRSLGLDTRILWKTIRKVFQREGISLDGHATMPEFTGNNQRAS